MLNPINEDHFILVIDPVDNSVVARPETISILGCEFHTSYRAWIFT
jgi:hypothetical protein